MFIPRLATAIAVCAGLSSGAAHAVENMRAVSFTPKNDAVMAMANVWVNEMNAKLGGQVRINYVGGPEVIGRFQQVEAIRNGVIDILFPAANDYQDQMPASGGFVLSKLSPSEERKSGFYDFMVKEHTERLGVRYLGRVQVSPFYLWTKIEPKRLEDMRGLKMRTGVLYDRMMREFGMVPVTINAPEVFTAIDSGVVDGFGWPVTGPLRRGWLDKVRYVVDLPFFGASNVVILMNQRRWDALPKPVQDQIVAMTAEFEGRMVAHFEKANEDEWKEIGTRVKRVTFSDAENKRYLDTAYELEWQALQQRAPDQIGQLRRLSGN
jgi:TRAP-type transport system periplasmic protein